MAEFDSFINIENIVQSEDSAYVKKDISIDNNLKITTPFKIINVSKVQSSQLSKFINKGLVEKTKHVNQKRSFDSLYIILEEPIKDQKTDLNNFFKITNHFKTLNSVISLSFSKNPFVPNKFKNGMSKPIKYSNFEYLLDYLQEYSTLFILIPDIDINSFNSFEEYKNYIENAVNTTSSFNNKPIFVPLSMKLNTNQIKELLYYYKKQNYSNIWFNFNSTQINSKLSNIRYSLRWVKNFFKDTAMTYFSNMKKEMNKNIDDIYTKPSDFLAPFCGCDFLGANRESAFGGNNKKMTKTEREEFKKKNILNQNRIFDSRSYYYYSILQHPGNIMNKNKILETNGLSDLLNSNILNNELNQTKNFIEENKNIGSYLKNKKMITEDSNLKEELLFHDETQSTLLNIIDNLDI